MDIRSNKPLLFGGMGALGGACGALLAGAVPQSDAAHSGFHLVLSTAIWTAVCASFLSLGLFWAGNIYRRQPRLTWRLILAALSTGALGGALAGCIAQAVFNLDSEPSLFKDIVLRSFCWCMLGSLLGLALARAVPNLGIFRGMLGGSIGGFVGGLGFLITSGLFAELAGQIAGISTLGLALGLSIVAVEALLREASLEVIWASKEMIHVTLGPRTVYIGGGDDHVFIAGLPRHAAGIRLSEGRIEYTEPATGRTTELRDGSRLQIGRVNIVIHASI